jgi:hypothetical protein
MLIMAMKAVHIHMAALAIEISWMASPKSSKHATQNMAPAANPCRGEQNRSVRNMAVEGGSFAY